MCIRDRSFTSILVGEPSNFSIQALEETSIHVTDYRNIQELYKRHPAWQELGRKIAEDNFIVKTKREEQLLLYSAQDRYKNFCKNFPHLLGVFVVSSGKQRFLNNLI